jgi:RecA-family ATPase
VLDWRDHWRECPDKGDVSQWRDEVSGTMARLFEIIERLRDWAPEVAPAGASEASASRPDEAPPDDGYVPVPSYEENRRTFAVPDQVVPLPPLPFIDMSNWDNEPVPQQEWSVLNRIPRQQCVLFSGEGGAGKSIIGLHECAAHVLGREWLGTPPERGPALFVDAEDEEDVIHRRLAAICSHYGVKFADLIKRGLHLMSFFGRDAVLATVSRSGKMEPTPLYGQLLEAAGDIKPVMMVIASAANVYAGNESDRPQVQQFVGLMTRLAIIAHGSLALISHPSLTGISTDTGLSGTTQWHNAVRARFYLKGIKPEEGEPTDTDLRELVFKKNNYGPISESIALRYANGLFLPVAGTSSGSLDKMAQERRAEDVFLDLLARFTRDNRTVGAKPGTSYAPALFAREEEAKRLALSSKALEAAMRRLFSAQKIWNEPYGKRPSYRIARK